MTAQNDAAPDWESQVDPAIVRSVKLATAAFSLARMYFEVPYADTRERFTDPAMAATWPQRDPRSLAALEAIGQSAESQLIVGRDFEALFGPTQLVPGRESGWTGGDSAALTQEMRRIYGESNYTPIRDGALPMDHFAVQFSYVGDRVAKSASDPGAARDALDFIETHLDTYVPRMLRALDENAVSVFYQSVSVLTQSTLAEIREHCRAIANGEFEAEAAN